MKAGQRISETFFSPIQFSMMKTKNIYQENNRENKQGVVNVQRMTSLEIAEVTGKKHCDVMRAIRNMESAWVNVCGRKFALTSRTVTQPNGGMRQEPCYELTKAECLYIATKFNDEARARLVLRWQELELAERERQATLAQVAPLIDLSGSKGSQASIILIMGADGTALTLTPEVLARLLAAHGNLLPALPEYRPYHGPVRTLVARTEHGIVREGVDDYTLYIRIPSKAYLEALDVSKETFFEAEFAKLMVQCCNDECNLH